MFSEVDNVKCVASTHLTFCDSQINQGHICSRSPQESAGNTNKHTFLSPLSLTKQVEALTGVDCCQA